MKKQIIKIALYDGWVKYAGMYKRGKRYLIGKPMIDYATNLNELHRVAIKVRSQLWDINSDDAGDLIQNIVFGFFSLPIRSRYTHLIKAVADGIDYLNTKKV